MSDWKESLPEEIRSAPGLKDVKDVSSLAKQFIDQQAHLGNSIRIPSAEASDEDRKAFYEKLQAKVPGLIPTPNPDDPEMMRALHRKFGMPEKPEDYEIPEEAKKEEADRLRPLAHKLGLTKAQFKEIVKDMTLHNVRVENMNKINIENGLKALRNEWGVAFEDRFSQVQKALVATSAPKPLQDAVVNGSAGPETIKWLHSIYKQLGAEGVNLASGGPGAPERSGNMTPAEAKARIEDILRNKEHAYWNQRSPLHQQAIQEMIGLHRMANPNDGESFGVRRAG